MQRLEREGHLDRALEFLPTTEELSARIEEGGGLTAPELAVLLSYTKIVLAHELIETDLPDDPFLAIDLQEYFPETMRRRTPTRSTSTRCGATSSTTRWSTSWSTARASPSTTGCRRRPARRRRRWCGPTSWRGRSSGPGRSSTRLLLRQPIDDAPQIAMRFEMRTLVERASRWLINNRRPPLDSAATVDSSPRAPAAARGAARAAHRTGGAPSRPGEALLDQGVPRTCRAGGDPVPGVRRADDRRDRQAGRGRPGGRGRLTSRSASGSASRCWSTGSWPCRARTAGRPWPGRRCATTCTRCTAADRSGADGDVDGQVGPRADPGLGGATTRPWWVERWPRCRRSAPTGPPTSPGCRWACGWCGPCWPPRAPR